MMTSPFKFTDFYAIHITDLKAIYRLLEKEWISYSDLEAMQAVRKLRKIIEEHELGPRDSRPSL